jgi:hypothetical protein
MNETELLCAVARILSKPGDLTVQDLDELNTINEEMKLREDAEITHTARG